LHPEVCHNGIDDNCNGFVDEMPCVVPEGGSCSEAIALGGPGTYAISTAGAVDVFPTSCSVTTPAAAGNVVATVTVPPGANQDLVVWATTSDVEVAVAIDGSCGDASTELACGSGKKATSVRARARDVAPGTYSVVVTTQASTRVDLEVDLLAPTSPATNVDCSTALPVTPGTPTTVSIDDAPVDVPSACSMATGELTYSVTLPTVSDVHVQATTLKGSGAPVFGFRDTACAGQDDELDCRQGGPALVEHSLPPGTYVMTVGANSPIDALLDVEVSTPTPVTAGETCGAPPSIPPNGRASFDLSNSEDAIHDGCFPDAPHQAFDLSLPVASDVLLVERLGTTDTGGVSLDPPACDDMSVVSCATGTTPVRTGKRNVPAGDYRAVVGDALALDGSLDALVRPTVAPTLVPPGGSMTCSSAVDASSGGFFTGDTSTSKTTYTSPCDSPTAPSGGELAQVLALNLTSPQRVVLDMEGSAYTTLLDVRQGPDCPGTPVDNACYVGFAAQKSFLDLELMAGQYSVLVMGYQGDKGAWDLDVRVLPP
jgi:hypothetical protein